MLKGNPTNQTKTMLLLMLVFTVVILLFSGLVYFSIVNFSHQRFYELLKIRATTIVQIEKSKEHLDIPKNHILNSLNDEELPVEKDYYSRFRRILITVRYQIKSIFRIFFSKALSKKEKPIIMTKNSII